MWGNTIYRTFCHPSIVHSLHKVLKLRTIRIYRNLHRQAIKLNSKLTLVL